MIFEAHLRFENGAMMIGLVPVSPEQGREYDGFCKAKFRCCSDAMRTLRDDFFSKGNGQAFTAAVERVRAAESAVAAAKYDVEERRKEWTIAIKLGEMTKAEKIEAAIAAAEAKVTRLEARTPVLRAEANAMRPAVAAELARQLEAARAEAEAIAKESSEIARQQLSQAISDTLPIWHGFAMEAAGSEQAKADIRVLAEIPPV